MAFHNTYSAKNFVVNYAGIDLSEGRPEDGFISISQNTPRAAMRKGLDGNTAASLSSDHSVNLTLSFFPESETAKKLAALYHSLRLAEMTGDVTLGAAPLVLSENSGATFLSAPETVLVNMGDQSFGADTGTVDFEFYVETAAQITLPANIAADVTKAFDGFGV